MATIGTFTKNAAAFIGKIQTLTFNAEVTFVPVVNKKGDKSPDYRALVNGDIDIGAAWKRISREQAEYLSVSLDDPSFPTPLQCSLVKTSIEHSYKLIWERQRPRD